MSAGPGAQAGQREQVAREERHWVRLTRACNNRCAFCLDELSREGEVVPEPEVAREIHGGRERGAERLILSGGEPTIHPAFLRLIREGRRAGYGHIQVVSNGRMFAYPKLLAGAIRAGLNEVTISVHGPDAETHDELVGVPGAFEQTMAGLRAALASGRLIVSVDVCLNRRNIHVLAETVERCIALGVTEFDLLQVIPFGRAFQQGDAVLAYDMEQARPHLQRVLALSERPGLHIWFNRFPPPCLEGYEQLIQDPHKLHDEVRGRQQELEAMVTQGRPLRCRQATRCQHCYLQPLCDAMKRATTQLARRDFDLYRVTVGADGVMPGPPPWPMARWWIRGPDLAAADRVLEHARAREVTLELEDYSGLDRWLGSEAAAGMRRAYAARVADLELLLDAAADFEVVALLSAEMAAHLERAHPDPPPRLALALRRHGSAAASARWDADLPAFFARYGGHAPVEGICPCISGRAARPRPSVLDASTLRWPLEPRPDGAPALDLHGFTEHFIGELNSSKSLRCRGCRHDARCPGMPLNYLRAHGYRTLQPVGA